MSWSMELISCNSAYPQWNKWGQNMQELSEGWIQQQEYPDMFPGDTEKTITKNAIFQTLFFIVCVDWPKNNILSNTEQSV